LATGSARVWRPLPELFRKRRKNGAGSRSRSRRPRRRSARVWRPVPELFRKRLRRKHTRARRCSPTYRSGGPSTLGH
jgi:hypothetical protein